MASLDLPLFPLSLVLMPDMILPLHIFEPRYREMIALCLQTDQRFGVILIREGLEVGEIATVYDVGTVAEITGCDQLDDGRMNLIAEGRQRFRLLERYLDRAYLHGLISPLDEPLGVAENVHSHAERARRLARRYVGLLLHETDNQTLQVEFPDDPIELSYRIANLLQQIHPARSGEMQGLLEAETVEDRLGRELAILGREYAILERMNGISEPRRRPYSNPN